MIYSKNLLLFIRSYTSFKHSINYLLCWSTLRGPQTVSPSLGMWNDGYGKCGTPRPLPIH